MFLDFYIPFWVLYASLGIFHIIFTVISDFWGFLCEYFLEFFEFFWSLWNFLDSFPDLLDFYRSFWVLSKSLGIFFIIIFRLSLISRISSKYLLGFL